MFTIDTKKIRYDYNTLSALVTKVNRNPLTDVITRARQISGENIEQVFSERHGGMTNAVRKRVGNALFVIFLDDTNGVLELSPYIHIKEPNGKIVLTWNIKDEIITYLPINI